MAAARNGNGNGGRIFDNALAGRILFGAGAFFFGALAFAAVQSERFRWWAEPQLRAVAFEQQVTAALQRQMAARMGINVQEIETKIRLSLQAKPE